jgi:catalase
MEHFNQATLFFNSLSKAEKYHLIQAARFELGKCETGEVRERMVERWNHVDHDLAVQVAEGLGINPPAPLDGWKNHGKSSPAVSQANTTKGSIVTRRVAFIVFDGVDADPLTQMRAAIKGAGGMTFIVAPRKGAIYDQVGKEATVADFTLLTSKSTLFDAIFVASGAKIHQLEICGDAITFVNEAFKHHKPICAVGNAVDFIRSSCVLPGIRLASTDEPVVSDLGVVTCIGNQVLGSVAGAASHVVGSTASGAVAGASGGAGGAAGEFIRAIGEYRFWDRDVSRVPA